MKMFEFQIHNLIEVCSKVPIDNSALIQKMVWCQKGDKPLSEPMMVYVGDEYVRCSASVS